MASGLQEAWQDYDILRVLERRCLENKDNLKDSIVQPILCVVSGNLDLDHGNPQAKLNQMAANNDPKELGAKLNGLITAQMSFGAMVAVPVAFYLGAFIYTIVDLKNKPSDQDTAISLAFGVEWMIVVHVAIVTGCLLASNNPSTVSALVGISPADRVGDGNRAIALNSLSQIEPKVPNEPKVASGTDPSNLTQPINKAESEVRTQVECRGQARDEIQSVVQDHGNTRDPLADVIEEVPRLNFVPRETNENRIQDQGQGQGRMETQGHGQIRLNDNSQVQLTDEERNPAEIQTNAGKASQPQGLFTKICKTFLHPVETWRRHGRYEIYNTGFQPVGILERGLNKKKWRDQILPSETHSALSWKSAFVFFCRILLPTMILIGLPSAAAAVVAYNTPPVGFSCRSLSFACYAGCQFFVTPFFLLKNHGPQRIQSNWLVTVLYVLAAIGSLFTSIGGTLMQILGVYRNCRCYITTFFWINTENAVVDVATDTDGQRRSSKNWIFMGVAATSFMVICSFLGWWYQRAIRVRYERVMDRL